MKNSKLCDTLRDLRKAKGYTQDYVASALGIVRQTYSHYETGKRTPDTATIVKLASLYGEKPQVLLELVVEIDRAEFYEAPVPSNASNELSLYIEYFNNPNNQKKYKYFTNLEKELLYYFEKISESDKKEIIEFTKIKARKR